MSAKVFLNMPLREPSRYGSLPVVLELPCSAASIGYSPKFIEPMLSEATSGLKVAAGRTRSSIVMVGAPPVVMFTTTFERCLMTLQERREGLRRLVGPAVLRIARVQMHDRGAGLGRADRGIGDLLGGHRQMRRHRRRVDRAGDGAGDDDFAALRHVSNPGLLSFQKRRD